VVGGYFLFLMARFRAKFVISTPVSSKILEEAPLQQGKFWKIRFFFLISRELFCPVARKSFGDLGGYLRFWGEIAIWEGLFEKICEISIGRGLWCYSWKICSDMGYFWAYEASGISIIFTEIERSFRPIDFQWKIFPESKVKVVGN